MIRRSRSSAVAFAFLFVAIGAAHAQDPAPPPTAAPPLRVLFIGNSLTYTNDLPGVVAGLSAQSPAARRIEAADVTFPNWTLRMHWESGKALRIIRAEHWDFVVLQGPPVDDQKVIALFNSEIQKAGARTILTIMYPSLRKRQPPDFYDRPQQTASALGILSAPAGPAWNHAAENGVLQSSLYDADGLHPSIIGTYLTACVIYSVITGTSPEGLRPRWGESVTGAPIVATLNSAAWRAVQETQRGFEPASSPK